MEKKRVLLGMSGGVDSSVCALLLKDNGYDVVGVTMELFGDSKENINDAKSMCDNIGIEYHSIDCRDLFKDKVINNFINEYSKQRTPNPCIECNKYMKFGKMLEVSKELECDYIATGHYARVEYSSEYKKYVLKKSSNVLKDQSYVLYGLPKELLKKVLFPLGDFLSKDDVRNFAKERELTVASKPDSEDICFVPEGNYKKFLEENSHIKPCVGNIVNKDGKILGKHNGLYNYTIGQRRGLGVSYNSPLFVIGFDSSKNEVVVGAKDEMFKDKMYVNNINLLLFDNLDREYRVGVKTRYSSKEEMAIIKMIDEDLIEVIFDNPAKMITPGQSAVFYVDDIVLGGGKIRWLICLKCNHIFVN